MRQEIVHLGFGQVSELEFFRGHVRHHAEEFSLEIILAIDEVKDILQTSTEFLLVVLEFRCEDGHCSRDVKFAANGWGKASCSFWSSSRDTLSPKEEIIVCFGQEHCEKRYAANADLVFVVAGNVLNHFGKDGESKLVDSGISNRSLERDHGQIVLFV